MSTSFDKLIEGWRACKLENKPYLFPGDEFLLEEKYKRHHQIISSFNKYIESPEFGLKSQRKLHLGLIPIPYLGNLKKASIYILMLNPGLAPGDFHAEEKINSYKKALVGNLHQKNLNDDYPFFALNPSIAWHPGFGYWRKKLGQIIRELASQQQIPYLKALRILAQNLACLELVPYHSKSFGAHSLINKLASSKAMLEYVYDVLVPRAYSGEALIIVTRSVKYWKLQECENIIVYNQFESRASHLSLKSRGGKAIAEHLGI